MFGKRVMRIFCVVGIAYLWQPVIETNNQSTEIKEIETEILDTNQHEIIMQGSASYGNNAISGRACIIFKKSDLGKIRPGDIVIASAIHSTWYAEMSKASGIVIEKGDKGSNAIALGKKLEIPVIVGAKDATKLIVDGQIISCDPISRNVRHISYSESNEFHFDTLNMPQKNHNQILSNKIGKASKTHSAQIDDKTVIIQSKDNSVIQQDSAIVAHNEPVYQAKRITKKVYEKHFENFKKYALSTHSQYQWGKKWGMLETGAKLTKRDNFTIECMAIGDLLLGSDKEHFIEVLKRIGYEKSLQRMDILIDKCVQKPKNMSEANWVARVSHQEHVRSVDIPEEIDKENLMEHPKEYKKIEHLVSKQEREDRIAEGIFALFCTDTKLAL